jgi:hypothetical protein
MNNCTFAKIKNKQKKMILNIKIRKNMVGKTAIVVATYG